MLSGTLGVMFKIKQLFTKKSSTSFAHCALFTSFSQLEGYSLSKFKGLKKLSK